MAPAPSAKMPKIQKLADLDESLNLLVYGDSGVGKTVFAGTADDGLIIASDKGTMSASRAGSKASTVAVNSLEDFEEITKWLKAGGHEKYRWLVVDGLTMLQEIIMVSIVEKAVSENSSRDAYIPAIQDYQKGHLILKRKVEMLCNMPVDVLFTALPMNLETPDGDEIVVPQVKGSKGEVSHYISGLMTCFGRMTVKEIKSRTSDRTREVRRITWKPDGPYTGKDRSGVLAPHTDDLKLGEIRDMISSSATTTRRATGSARRAGTTRTATRRPAPSKRRTA